MLYSSKPYARTLSATQHAKDFPSARKTIKGKHDEYKRKMLL